MALLKEDKAAIVSANARNQNDTGSPEVQVALLTARINDLNGQAFQFTENFDPDRTISILGIHGRFPRTRQSTLRWNAKMQDVIRAIRSATVKAHRSRQVPVSTSTPVPMASLARARARIIRLALRSLPAKAMRCNVTVGMTSASMRVS